MAGCPPDHTGFFLVNTDASNADIGYDTHMYVGTHINDRTFVSAGAGLEKETENPKYDAVVNAMELCPNMADYNVPGGTTLTGSTTNGTFKCKKNFKWSWRSNIANKSEKFGYVTASPDGSYVLAAGVREKQKTSSGFILQRYLVKINAATGKTVWELKMPINDPLIGNAAGYESLQFTEDGGFVVAGFTNYEGGEEFPFFKSSGSTDDATPFFEYYGPEVANAGALTTATPKWQFKCDPESGKPGTSQCDYGLGSIKSMRVFKENGVEKVVGIAKGTSFIVLNVSDGSVDKYANPAPATNAKTAVPSTDSNTDIEVEINAAGQAVFVTTGIHAGIDTVSKGCDNKGRV